MAEFMTKKLCQRVKGIFCLSLFVFSCYACQTTRDNDGKNIFYDDMVKCTRLVDLFEGADYEVIPLEVDSIAIPVVGMKFFAHQDYFLIGDNQYARTIFLYDSNGKFLHAIGSRGKGPDEYSELVDFSVWHDTISVADVGSSGDCFLYYGLDGNFLGKTEVSEKVISFARNQKGEYIINSGRNAFQSNWQITRYTSDLKILEQCWKLDENENNIPVFEHNFNHSDNGVFFHEAFNNQLHKLVDNQFEPSYKLVFDDKNDFTGVRTGNFMAEMESMYKEGFYPLNDYLENDSFVFLSLDYVKDLKNEKQVLAVFNKNLGKGKVFVMPPSTIFMGNLKDNALYLMAEGEFVGEQFPNLVRAKETDIFIIKVML